jgi:hypothetical protein
VLVAWACWRTQFGIDEGDGAHSVVLGIRIARGDLPFVDETSTQSTGSLLAGPVTWLWLQVVGTEGIVLVSRLLHVAVATVVGVLAYRALRPSVSPWVALAIPSAAMVPTAYNLIGLNYTTVPALAMVLATASGFAAVQRASVGWAATAGAAAVMAGFTHPAMVVAAVIFLLVALVLANSARVRIALVVGAMVAGLVAGGWLLLAVGVDPVRETLAYTSDFQSARSTPRDRLRLLAETYRESLLSLAYLPMWVLALLASLPRLRRGVRGLLALGVIVAAAGPSLLADTEQTVPLPFGRFTGVYAAVVVLALALPAVAVTVRERREPVAILVLLALPPALVAAPLLVATSSAHPAWGAVVTCLAPAFGVLAALPALLVDQDEAFRSVPSAVAAAALIPLVAVAGLQTLTSFRDPEPWLQSATISEGPYRGIHATPERARQVDVLAQQVRRHARREDSVLVWGNPAAYLFVPGRINTNKVWTPPWGAHNQFTVDYFEQRGDVPDLVFLPASGQRLFGNREAWRRADPLVDFVLDRYDAVRVSPGSTWLVFRLR